MGEEIFVKLRDCFTAGYTLPQYCIDNGIKKPLFVSEKKYELFLWEVYVQFRYDKRLSPQFSVLDAPSGNMNFSLHAILPPLTYKNFSEINSAYFDKIIFLTTNKKFSSDKTIYLDALTDYFIRKTYAEIPLLNFLQRYPKVKLILTKFPDQIWRYKDSKEFIPKVKYMAEMINLLRSEPSGNVKTPLDKLGYTNQEFFTLMMAPKIKTNSDGSTTMEDDPNPLMRIKNGKRETAYQPEKFLNRIYFVGSCHDFGIHAPFDKTIASYLQKMLNDHNLSYRVENESQRYFCRYQDIFYNINKLTPAPGDIIFCWIDNMSAENLPYLDLSDAFDPPHDYREFYCTRWHVNELGYKILAERYFKFLTANNFFRKADINPPPPQSTNSPLRYTAAIRDGRRKKFFQPRTRRLQEISSREETANRSNRYELQPVHTRSSISCRICGGEGCKALYLCCRGG